MAPSFASLGGGGGPRPCGRRFTSPGWSARGQRRGEGLVLLRPGLPRRAADRGPYPPMSWVPVARLVLWGPCLHRTGPREEGSAERGLPRTRRGGPFEGLRKRDGELSVASLGLKDTRQTCWNRGNFSGLLSGSWGTGLPPWSVSEGSDAEWHFVIRQDHFAIGSGLTQCLLRGLLLKTS